MGKMCIRDRVEVLSPQWSELRGVELVSFGVNSISVSEEDKKKIQDMNCLLYTSRCV